MEALVVIGGFIYIGVLGFWIMGKVDRFLDQGGFLTEWDKTEEVRQDDSISPAEEQEDTDPENKAFCVQRKTEIGPKS